MIRKTSFLSSVFLILVGLFLFTPSAIALTNQSYQSLLSSLAQQLSALRLQLAVLISASSTFSTTVCNLTLDSPQQLLAADGAASDFFGYSVAVSGDVALVGAKLDDDRGANSGSAYVFRRSGSTWVQEQRLFGLDEIEYDSFGTSVAIDGNTAVVAAPNRDDKGVDSGAVYVFRWNGASWVQEQKLLASDGASPDLFGSSVSVSGNMIVVGANQESNGRGYKAGSAYVFRWNGASWVQEQKLLASDGAATDYFGYSVSASGDVIVIGAYGDDDLGNAAGSAYVFRWNGSSWVQEQKLLAINGVANDVFGTSVAVSDNKIVVGAYWDHDSGIWTGSAYVFRFNGSTWIQETELYPLDGATNDYFGSAVSISGDMVVVGAYQDDDKGGNSGSAYLFRFNGSTWIQETKLLDPNGASNDRFGYSVAASGDRAMIGAYWDDNIKGADAGSSFVFTETCAASPDTIPPSINLITPVKGTLVFQNTTITLVASATDNVGVTKVEFYVNGVLKGRDTTSPYSYPWWVPLRGKGNYQLQAKAYDAAGNIGSSAIVTVTAQ